MARAVHQRERPVGHATSQSQHVRKALIRMDLQPHHVVMDVSGTRGIAIIRAILGCRQGIATPAAKPPSRTWVRGIRAIPPTYAPLGLVPV